MSDPRGFGVQDKIISILTDHPEGLLFKDIHSLIAASHPTVYKHLIRLVAMKKVERVLITSKRITYKYSLVLPYPRNKKKGLDRKS